jgi:hypothetical protein
VARNPDRLRTPLQQPELEGFFVRQDLIKLLAAATLAVSIPAIARAEIVVYGPTSLATAQGTGVGGGSSYGVGIRNGVQDPFYGTTGAVAGNALENSASGSAGGATSSASANLADGSLHASGATSPGATSFAFAELGDTLYFNNTSGGVVGLDVRFELDGSIATPADNPFPGGYGSLTLNGCGGCGDIRLGAFGAPVGPAANVEYLIFDRNGIRVAENTGASGPPEGGTYDYGSTFNAGYMTGFLATTVYLPTGLSTLGVRTQLNLDCRLGAVCDFGNTAALKFGPLADGLSYTSASGGFLSATGAGVPEPATWAMMIFGFAMTGGALRGLRRKVAIV